MLIQRRACCKDVVGVARDCFIVAKRARNVKMYGYNVRYSKIEDTAALKYTPFLFQFEIHSDFIINNCHHAYLFSSVLQNALTFQSAQGRCPGGCAEQACHREQDHRRKAGSHRGLSRFGKWSSVRSDFSTQVQNCCFQLRRIPNPISPGFSQFRKKKNTALHRPNPRERNYGLFLRPITTQIKIIFLYFSAD